MSKEAPNELKIKQGLRDIHEATAVEFVVDQHGKCWLNVDDVCVARIGFADFVAINFQPRHTREQGEIRLQFERKKS